MSKNSPGEPLLRLLRIYMRHSVEDMTAMLREHGLSMPQLGTLQLLRAEGTQTVSNIASHLNLSLGATSHLVERLVQKDLVVRQEDPHDRRQKLVDLTPGGVDLVAEMDQRAADSMAGLLEPVPEGSRQALYDAAQGVVRELGEMQQRPATDSD